MIAARILDVLPHPNADKLRLVDIDFGSGQTRVVCGAPNVTAGMVVPYAPSGATLPGGFTLERRNIRGDVSDGMLLLGARARPRRRPQRHRRPRLGESSSATTCASILGLDDVIFDLSITPNRPDAMCIVGVARELAAHFGCRSKSPSRTRPPTPRWPTTSRCAIDAPDRCPRYLGRVAQVTMGPSPPWMAQRLVKAGMRPISNVVDVTNYVLLERNQPLHAFDLARLGGRGILVRRRRPTASASRRSTAWSASSRRRTS